MVKKNETKIKKDTNLEDLSTNHPDIADYLQNEYGFHCMNCVLAGFETLEQGAAVHGVTGSDLDQMINEVNEKISS
jgi:hybrid cluster-associated redox disulfide protein